MIFLVNITYSILIINILFQIGNIVLKKIKIEKDSFESFFFISIILGYALSASLLQYLLIFDFNIIKYVFLIIIFLGLLRINFFFKQIKYLYDNLKSYNSLIGFVFFLLFLSIFHPVNDADSLGYHFFIPKEIIAKQAFEWNYSLYTFGLIGIGEFFNVIITLFSSSYVNNIIQYFSLVFIFFELFGYKSEKHDKLKYIAFLSIPCLIYFFFSGKPHLIALSISIFLFRRSISSNLPDLKLIIFLLLLLPLIKPNFVLSSIFLSILIFKRINFRSLTLKTWLVSSILIFLLYFPIIYFKKVNGFDLGFELFSPLKKNFPGKEEFLEFLSNYKGINDFPLPFNLFISNNIGEYSTLLGISFTLLLIKKSFKKSLSNLISFIYLLIIPFFIQPTARFIIEPLLWIYIANENTLPLIKNELIKYISYPLLGLQIIFISIFTYNSIYSIFDPKKINSKTTYGYNYSQKVNELIKSDSGIILDHRSKSLFNQKLIYSIDFIAYGWKKKDIYNYLEPNKIEFIVVMDHNLNSVINYSKRIIKGPIFFNENTRNPISKNIQNKFWILEFDKNLMCIE